MVRRARSVATGLLSSDRGHVTRAPSGVLARADAIEAFAHRVGDALRASRADGLERGFLAYATPDPAAPPVPEPDAVGEPDAIRWRWDEPHAAVAFSFHTHPGPHALCVPSGIDMVGALVRGDHVTYVLTMDGRLSGWRFRDREGIAWSVEDAMSTLDRARGLTRGFLDFLYASCDAVRDQLVECVYAARVTLHEDDGVRVERVDPDAAFFPADERS